MLLIGWGYINDFYKFSTPEVRHLTNGIKVLNYNVRLFNLYNWLEGDMVAEIQAFIEREEPDVISFQEYHPHPLIDLPGYTYRYEQLSGNKVQYGQAIFSKYPIVNDGSITFPETSNNAIFADVLVRGDTIRVYNLHLQSFKLESPPSGELDGAESQRLFRRVRSAFVKQQEQADLFVAHRNASPYSTIVCGDFNNTAYSYVYNLVKGDMKDSFESAGTGFGKTFAFPYFPIRIDFILYDPRFEAVGFETYDQKLSDHYPIMAHINLR